MSTVEATALRDRAAAHPAAGTEALFTPYRLGDLELKNRLVLSPMTRSRALDGNVPNPLAATYYTQRSSAGLIITEATQISPQGVGYIRTPGMHTPAQVAGWKKVTEAVHTAGGRIFAQLWHVGRVSHPDFHNGALPVAPSALPVEGEAFTNNGKVKIPTPRALELNELPAIVAQFSAAAENAKAAGFDGIELHGANGYLLDQFLRDGANHRGDTYGGSLENRARFPLEVADAVIAVWGPNRVGYKLSPYFAGYSMSDSKPVETFSYMAEQLNRRKIGYIHIGEAIAGPMAALAGTVRGDADAAQNLQRRRDGQRQLRRPHRQCGDRARRGRPGGVRGAVPRQSRSARPLLERQRADAPDFATFYAGEEKGYLDYPALA